MKPAVDPHEKTVETGATEPGHAVWKRGKIERGLAQAKDRAAMIPIEKL